MVFVAIGRATHEEGLTALGVLSTAWPFVVALSVAWLVQRAWRRPRAVVTGVLAWILTVIIGLTLRVVATPDTAAVAFIIVTTVTLALFLIGWRLIAKLILARREG